MKLVHQLSDLGQLYSSRMEQLGVKLDTRVHTTRLKHRLLAQFRDMRAQKNGRDILLAFEEDVGAALVKICESDNDKFVIMMGGLHIEMATLKTLGDWLEGSGWVQALVQADLATPGTADSFLQAAHVMRTRRVHQVTLAALYILKHRAYDDYCLLCARERRNVLGFMEWCDEREDVCPQFRYWAIAMKLELYMLVLVRSLRQGSFEMYLDALAEHAPWFHAFNHTNYARWVPVHLRDMIELSTKHPEVAAEFNHGNFTIQITNRVFSSIAIDQAHEQHNAYVKGDGGAVGLTNNPNALRRWMIAGPEIARVIEEFHAQQNHCKGKVTTLHHDQIPSVRSAYAKDVRSLVSVIEDLGNPCQEESTDLLVLDSKEIADQSAVKSGPIPDFHQGMSH